MTSMSPRWAVRNRNQAIEFYEVGLGAKIWWELEGAIAEFFLAEPSPEYGTRARRAGGFGHG